MISPNPTSAMRTSSAPPLSGPASELGSRQNRLSLLKARVPKPGEASFFFYDAHFKNEAVKILPGEYFVFNEDLLIMTTLGSCIATCLWDRNARIGGMNHFLLPDNAGGSGDSGRYGSFAMEVLINEMLKMGASRSTLEAKVFGGGAVMSGMSSLNVGERNTSFVLDYLKAERIPVVSKDVLDVYPRKVCFFPHTGKAMVKRLATANPEAIVAQERLAAQKAAAPAAAGGSIDIF